MESPRSYSVVIPAFNEGGGIERVIKDLLALDSQDSKRKYEVVIVNDASIDDTAMVVEKYPVRLVSNVQNSGYGYSLKHGIREATHDHIIILDADGTYPVSEILKLLDEYEKGFDMVVGARHGKYYRGTMVKRFARFCFRALSEFVTGRNIPDINSGLRVFRRETAMRFFHTLSSGFSFTTTITLAFMLNAHSVTYVPIDYLKRKGNSKVRYVRDTLRSAQIIIEAIIFYNPLKIYLLLAISFLVGGIVSLAIGYFVSVFSAILFFFSVSGALLMLAIGFVVVFLRFMNNEQQK